MDIQTSPAMSKLWSDIADMGLWTEKSNIDFDTFNALITNDRAELEDLLSKQWDDVEIETMQLDDLLKMPFNQAKQVITNFSMKNRLRLLQDLNKRKEHYYVQTSRFCGVSKEDLITATEFRSILGKIKHMEVLMNWFYGID